MIKKIRKYLGNESEALLNYRCEGIKKETLNHRDGIGYLSVLPVAQGIEHSAGASYTLIRYTLIRKCAGGMGLIIGHKAFQRPMTGGVKLLNMVQDVYHAQEVTIA